MEGNRNFSIPKCIAKNKIHAIVFTQRFARTDSNWLITIRSAYIVLFIYILTPSSYELLDAKCFTRTRVSAFLAEMRATRKKQQIRFRVPLGNSSSIRVNVIYTRNDVE